jgi:hypothetical protein
MDLNDPETTAMLYEARSKAERLLSELLKQQAEVEANPPKLATGQLEAGRQAMQKAMTQIRIDPHDDTGHDSKRYTAN